MSGRELVIDSKEGTIQLGLQEDSLSVKWLGKKRRDVDVTYHQVISAKTQVVNGMDLLQVYCLLKQSKNRPLVLSKIEGKIDDETRSSAAEWVNSLMQAAYGADIKSGKRLRVLVNPHGGRGHAVKVFTEIVEPILRAANCELHTTVTTRRGHACEITRDMSLDYDAVVVLSGDGLIHEVINGFAQHANPAKAFSIPLAPIPTGSGNGLSLNLLGLEDGFDVAAATLNVIKGRPMKTDVFTVTQNDKQTLSFMSQATGLMADLDLGTEHLRWMGDGRFVYGFLRGLVAFKPCPVQLSIKVAEQDKNVMAKALHDQKEGRSKETPVQTGAEDAISCAPKDLGTEPDTWITFDKPILFLLAGQGPFVARDFMAFPVSVPDDGLIDIVVQELSSRKEMVTSMDGAPRGEPYWLESQHYYKAHAYRVKPLSTKGNLAIDGEKFPFEEFEVTVQPGLATLLSPHGRYASQLPAVQRTASV